MKNVIDKNEIAFHMLSNDYFGTVATILDLLKQGIEKEKSHDLEVVRVLERVRDGLLYAQQHYDVTERRGAFSEDAFLP